MWVIPEDIGKNDPVNMDHVIRITRDKVHARLLFLIKQVNRNEEGVIWSYDSKEKRDAAYERIIKEISGQYPSRHYIDSSKCV